MGGPGSVIGSGGSAYDVMSSAPLPGIPIGGAMGGPGDLGVGLGLGKQVMSNFSTASLESLPSDDHGALHGLGDGADHLQMSDAEAAAADSMLSHLDDAHLDIDMLLPDDVANDLLVMT
jgi:hypothetical protein